MECLMVSQLATRKLQRWARTQHSSFPQPPPCLCWMFLRAVWPLLQTRMLRPVPTDLQGFVPLHLCCPCHFPEVAMPSSMQVTRRTQQQRGQPSLGALRLEEENFAGSGKPCKRSGTFLPKNLGPCLSSC